MIFKHLFLHKLRNKFFGDFPRLSYSRSGEDLVVEEFFRGRHNGFFIDIGAYDPIAFNNTYKFYLRGWRGINIDPSTEAIRSFKKVRPEDINLNFAIANYEGEMDYYIFEGDNSMNTVSDSFLKKAQQDNKLQIKEVRKVPVLKLSNVLRQHLPPATEIDFMTVDVEGLDVEVLKSNDWNVYRPKVLCVETDVNMISIQTSKLVQVMQSHGYEIKAYTYLTSNVGNAIFLDQKNS